MLGGSGSHNSNVYNRGSPLDFDYWAKLLGDVTWDYNHMLEHFKDTENFVGQLVNERQRSGTICSDTQLKFSRVKIDF